MTRICLDTSAYSQFQRGSPEAVQAITGARSVLVPAVALGEIRAGFLLGSHADRNERALAEFLAHPAVRILDVDDETATVWADLFADLRRAGTPVPTNDLWIAASAVREGATVLTYDDHFRSIARVGCRVLGG